MKIPKVATLLTGLTVAGLVAITGPSPAQATPDRGQACTSCHGPVTADTVKALPSTTTPAAGGTYTLQITLAASAEGGETGYWVDGPGGISGGPSTAMTYTATMTAPATAGTQSYTVWTRQGTRVGSAVYTITVGAKARASAALTTTAAAPATTTTTTAPARPPLVGLGGVALLLAGVGTTWLVRRRRQI